MSFVEEGKISTELWRKPEDWCPKATLMFQQRSSWNIQKTTGRKVNGLNGKSSLNFKIGFTDDETVMLDFDNTSFKDVRYWAHETMKRFKLGGLSSSNPAKTTTTSSSTVE